MTKHMLPIDGVDVPAFFYGTAWKEEQTQHLTELVIACGFRGIDTANQRRHYDEAAVGRAISAAISKGVVARGDLFLQTKFTFRRGQDHRLPYDPEAAIPVQVEQSFASSLGHMGVEQIDSYLLHGPTNARGLAADDWAAWRAMETIHDSRRARMLGVSNFQIDQLQQLWQKARVRPRFVQNRCYASLGWDRQVREFCRVHGVTYQGFSLLTANRQTLAAGQLAQIAARHRRTIPQIVFRFAIQIGMIPLTGTTDSEHMQADLEVFDFRLEPDEVAWIEGWGTGVKKAVIRQFSLGAMPLMGYGCCHCLGGARMKPTFERVVHSGQVAFVVALAALRRSLNICCVRFATHRGVRRSVRPERAWGPQEFRYLPGRVAGQAFVRPTIRHQALS